MVASSVESMEIKRGRGRPRKNTTTNAEEENLIHESQSEEEIEGWEEEIESSEEEVEDSEEEREMTNDHLAKVIDDFIDEDMDGNQAPDSILGLPKTVTGEPKKSRGRPRKNKVMENGEAGVSRNVEGDSDEEDGNAKTNGDNGSASKKRRGRPPKSAEKKTPAFSSLVSNNGHASEKRRPGRPRKSDGRSLSIGNMEELDGVVPNTPVDESAKKSRKGRPRKRPLENGSASGHVGASSVGHSEGRLGFVSKDPKKAKILDVTPLRKSTRYMSPPRVDGHRQTAAEAAAEDVKDSPSMNAVVKVFCVHTEPNFSLPWQRKRQFSSNSSGFVIEGRRVLTNAHSVEHHTQVKLKKRGSDTKYLAKVLAIGTECDIAMLSVDDDEFWEGVSPVQFGELPTLQDAVTVVGYPIGGDTISVTSGVVSRIEVLSYVHGSTELIGVQIDAAINAGNSGGPAFSDKGQCVGIAFQSLKHEDAENIGYVIPTPVIRHFITDYERNGEYTGFPMLGIEWQKMENPDLRVAMGMNSNQKGVRIRRVEPTAPASEYLKSSDILLSFDGIDIANDGTVPFRRGERIGFTYLVSQKYTGENANVRILRESIIHEFDIQLSTQKRLVPAHIKGKPPSYYIVAGFVFSSVSVPYLRSEYGKDYDFDAPVKLLDKLLHSLSETEDEQLVVISQVLVADINIGYEDIVNTQVLSVNGVRVRNLKHLAEMVEKCEQEFLKFDLEYHQIVVLATQKAKEATLDILKTHCIPSAMSEDLKM